MHRSAEYLRSRSRFALAAALACVTALAACSGPSPSKADLIGTWEDGAGGRLIFAADGSVTAEKPDARGQVHANRARWALTAPAGRSPWMTPSSWDSWRVAVLRDGAGDSARIPQDLLYTRSHGEAVIQFPYGTPDVERSVRFRKVR